MDKVIDVMGGSMFFIMVLFTGFNVISFWTTGRRYGQIEEVVTSCLVWVSYLCLGEHYRKKECISADFLVAALPPLGKKITSVFMDIASFIIGAFILYYGIRLMMRSTNKFTGVLKICYFWIDMGLVLGFVSLVYNIVLKYLPIAKDAGSELEKGDSV
jgi:TRAP-type C4-dicarboxylate transport system permease small subunit